MLFEQIVGGMKFNPITFYDLLLVEASLIIQGNRKAKEEEFHLMETAVLNAVGMGFGGKGFKPINPFGDNKKGKSKKKTRSRDDLLAELESIKKGFKNDN